MMKLIDHEVTPVPWKSPSPLKKFAMNVWGLLFYSWPLTCLTVTENVFCAMIFPPITILITMALYSYVYFYLKFAVVLAYTYGKHLYQEHQLQSVLG